MSWCPPRSAAARSEWAKAHPWWVGCWVGVAMFVIAMLYEVQRETVWHGIVASAGVAALSVIVFVPFFTLATERHRGQRPDAGKRSLPGARRSWSRASDRFLLGAFVVSVGGTVLLALRLIMEQDHRQGAIVGLVCGAWVVATTWAERRHRRSAV